MNIFYLEVSVALKNYAQTVQYHINNLYKYFDCERYKACENNVQRT
jgi:hypothetical protein